MLRLIQQLVAVRHPYQDPAQAQRAATLNVLSLLLLAVTLVHGLVSLMAGRMGVGSIWQAQLAPAFGVAALLFMAAYLLSQRGQVTAGSWLAVMAAFGTIVPFNLVFGVGNAAIVGYIFPVIAASALIGWQVATLVVVAALGVVGWLGLTELNGQFAPISLSLTQQIIFALIVAGDSLFTMLLLGQVVTNRLQRDVLQARRTATQLRAASEVGTAAMRAADVQSLMRRAAEQIRTDFGFYHAQVFLVNPETRQVELQASTGHAGQVLLARHHQLAVGSRSVIGRCTASGEPVVVNDVLTSDIHRPNPLLPDTRAELALPLLIGDRVIGALDVQSIQPNAFGPEDISTLQVMAAQLANTINNARLLDDLKAQTAETTALYQQAQASLSQIEQLNRSLTREGWREYLGMRPASAPPGHTLSADQISQSAVWTAPMRQAYQGEQSVVIQKPGQAHIAAIPIKVHGEVIGVLEVERGGDRAWNDDDLALAEALVERLAQAIDNARLFEQVDALARRERLVNELTQSVQQADSVDSILQSTLAELSRALGAERGVVQLRPKTGPPADGDGQPAAGEEQGQ
jgi:GAF domain-containing protein